MAEIRKGFDKGNGSAGRQDTLSIFVKLNFILALRNDKQSLWQQENKVPIVLYKGNLPEKNE